MKRLSIRRRFVRIPVPTVIFTKIHKESIKKRLFTSIPTLHRIINTDDPDFGAGEEWTIPAGKLTRSVNFSYQGIRIGIRQIILSLDGTIYLKDIEGNDWTDQDVSSHDLATIANTIDNTIKESQRNTAS